ncbi:MAG: molybdopterin-dependent oxidoreductase [Granulicella sp.]
MADEINAPLHPEEPVDGDTKSAHKPLVAGEEVTTDEKVERPEAQSATASEKVTTDEKVEILKAQLPEEVKPDSDTVILAQSRKYTRRSFAVAAVGAAAAYGFYRWIDTSADDMMQPTPLRRAFQTDAKLSRAVFDERALAPTYRLDQAESLRVNGVYGLKQALIPESWRLQLVGVRGQQSHPRFSNDVTAWEYRYSGTATDEDKGHDTKVAPGSDTAEKMSPESMLVEQRKYQDRVVRMPRGQEEAGESESTLKPNTAGLLLTMQDLLKLPRHELVTQFKCIEGWSQIVHWAGVRMADFLEAYPPAPISGKEPKYVYMETPNGDYYTGYDMDICRHPQTLLVTEMMGEPLTQYHGAPLRLHMPTKYGYKQIKRIGLISYNTGKPDDYWAKLGYDWYAGL